MRALPEPDRSDPPRELTEEERRGIAELKDPQWGLGCVSIGGWTFLLGFLYGAPVSLLFGLPVAESFHPLMRLQETVHATAREVVDAYDRDQEQADRKYGHKPLSVTVSTKDLKPMWDDPHGVARSGDYTLLVEPSPWAFDSFNYTSHAQTVALTCFGVEVQTWADDLSRREKVDVILRDCSVDSRGFKDPEDLKNSRRSNKRK